MLEPTIQQERDREKLLAYLEEVTEELAMRGLSDEETEAICWMIVVPPVNMFLESLREQAIRSMEQEHLKPPLTRRQLDCLLRNYRGWMAQASRRERARREKLNRDQYVRHLEDRVAAICGGQLVSVN